MHYSSRMKKDLEFRSLISLELFLLAITLMTLCSMLKNVCLSIFVGSRRMEFQRHQRANRVEVPKGWKLVLISVDMADYYPEDFEEEKEPKKKSWGRRSIWSWSSKEFWKTGNKTPCRSNDGRRGQLLTRLAVAAQKTKPITYAIYQGKWKTSIFFDV